MTRSSPRISLWGASSRTIAHPATIAITRAGHQAFGDYLPSSRFHPLVSSDGGPVAVWPYRKEALALLSSTASHILPVQHPLQRSLNDRRSSYIPADSCSFTTITSATTQLLRICPRTGDELRSRERELVLQPDLWISSCCTVSPSLSAARDFLYILLGIPMMFCDGFYWFRSCFLVFSLCICILLLFFHRPCDLLLIFSRHYRALKRSKALEGRIWH